MTTASAAGRLANARDLAEIRSHDRAASPRPRPIVAHARDQLSQIDSDVEAALSEIRAAAGDLLGERPESSLERLIERVEDRTSARTDALAAWEEIELARKKAGRAADEGDRIRLELSGALESVGIRLGRRRQPGDDHGRR